MVIYRGRSGNTNRIARSFAIPSPRGVRAVTFAPNDDGERSRG
jgi:hypothetical protein